MKGRFLSDAPLLMLPTCFRMLGAKPSQRDKLLEGKVLLGLAALEDRNPKVSGSLGHKPQDLKSIIQYIWVFVKYYEVNCFIVIATKQFVYRLYYSISARNWLTPFAQLPLEEGVYLAIIASGVVSPLSI